MNTQKKSPQVLRAKIQILLMTLVFLLPALGLVTSVLAGQTASPAASAKPADMASPDSRTITDMAGRKVVLPREINRAVVIKGACMVPGILSAMGTGDRLISGLCFKTGPDDLQLKIEPGYAKIEVIAPGDNGVAVESLLALKPDVVFVWTNVKNVDQLAAAGLAVVVTDISSWDRVKAMLSLVGQIMNQADRAQALIADMEQAARVIKDRTATLSPEKRKTALFISSLKPLTVMGKDSHNNSMIQLAGGIPAAADISGHFATVSLEKIYQADPDVIFISAAAPKAQAEILAAPEWQQLKAVKNKQVYTCPTGVFYWDKPGAEIGLFLQWQARLLYPGIFTPAEFKANAREWYKKTFRWNLSDQDWQRLTGEP